MTEPGILLTITLNPAIDLSFDAADWELGGVNRASKVHRAAGGKGINVSRVLAELGRPTKAIAVSGSAPGDVYRSLIERESFPFYLMEVSGDTRINVVIADTTDKKCLKVNSPGISLDERIFASFLEQFHRQLDAVAMIYLGGSLPPGFPDDAYAQIVQIASERHLPVIIDCEGEPLRLGVRAGAMIAKPNRHELSRLFRREITGIQSIREAAYRLLDAGAEYVVVTDGPGPIIAVSRDHAWTAYPPAIQPIGVTGAGDSLAAGLMDGLTNKLPFEESLRWAVAAGSACCLTPETELAHRSDIERLADQIIIESCPSSSSSNTNNFNIL